MKSITRMFVVSALSLSLLAAPLAGCAGQQGAGSQAADSQAAATDSSAEPTAAVDTSSLKTMADVMAIEHDSHTLLCNQSTLIYAINTQTAPVRAVAKITPELYEQLGALEREDENYDEQLTALIGPLELAQVDNLAAGIPAQEELDKYVGKTGQDLLNDGFSFYYLMNYGDETGAEVALEQGDYAYWVTFAESLPSDTEGSEEVVKNLTVKSISYYELSGAATDPDLF